MKQFLNRLAKSVLAAADTVVKLTESGEQTSNISFGSLRNKLMPMGTSIRLQPKYAYPSLLWQSNYAVSAISARIWVVLSLDAPKTPQ
jgi:hypothetical protein